MPSGNFVNNSDAGYRMLVEKQNHTKPTLKQKKPGQGVNSKGKMGEESVF